MPAFTVSDAARHCGVDRRTLQRAIRTGRLALTAEHRLTPEALAQAGYLPAAPQGYAAGTPYDDAAGLPREPCDTAALYAAGPPQDTPQELGQATALLALLERLTTAITDLHEEVRSLRDDLRQMPQRTPQGRRRGAPTAPQATPQDTPQDTPQEVRHAAAAPQGRPATPVPLAEALPLHIQRIAETAMQYDKLSLAELSQLLFDRDIYRTTAKDGSDIPVNKGTLHKWLGRARRAGLL
jgi:hypothetical protein